MSKLESKFWSFKLSLFDLRRIRGCINSHYINVSILFYDTLSDFDNLSDPLPVNIGLGLNIAATATFLFDILFL